jgi:antitoxin HicB
LKKKKEGLAMVTTTEKTETRSVEDYLKLPYSRLLVPDPEGGYTAEVLELPGCFSEGDTAEEALANLEQAAASWIEAALEQGQMIPDPTGDYEYSGKVALRLPRSTHRKAVQLAKRENISLNTFLVDAISARVGAGDVVSRMALTWDAKIDRCLSLLENRPNPQFVFLDVKNESLQLHVQSHGWSGTALQPVTFLSNQFQREAKTDG